MTETEKIQSKIDFLTKELEKQEAELKKAKENAAEEEKRNIKAAREICAEKIVDYLIAANFINEDVAEDKEKFKNAVIKELIDIEKDLQFVKKLDWKTLKF